MPIRILIPGGTPRADDHLCSRCRFHLTVRGTHLTLDRCRRLDIPITGHVSACSQFSSTHTDIPGAGYESAHIIVSIPGYGPTLLTPGESTRLEREGVYPIRFAPYIKAQEAREASEAVEPTLPMPARKRRKRSLACAEANPFRA